MLLHSSLSSACFSSLSSSVYYSIVTRPWSFHSLSQRVSSTLKKKRLSRAAHSLSALSPAVVSASASFPSFSSLSRVQMQTTCSSTSSSPSPPSSSSSSSSPMYSFPCLELTSEHLHTVGSSESQMRVIFDKYHSTLSSTPISPSLNTAEQTTSTSLITFPFGQHTIRQWSVFLSSSLCYATVNIAPVTHGHCMIVTHRRVARVKDMTPEELQQLMLMSQLVGSVLETHLGSGALTYCLQDGRDAGQTVPHIHMHILPRRKGDFDPNDLVYDEIDAKEKMTPQALQEQDQQLQQHTQQAKSNLEHSGSGSSSSSSNSSSSSDPHSRSQAIAPHPAHIIQAEDTIHQAVTRNDNSTVQTSASDAAKKIAAVEARRKFRSDSAMYEEAVQFAQWMKMHLQQNKE